MNMAQMRKLDKHAWIFAGVHTLIMLNVAIDVIVSAF